MKPMIAFWVFVAFSELSQWGLWKKNNPTKKWGEWGSVFSAHFMANMGIVALACLLWQSQQLDDVIVWCLSWLHLEGKYQWDQLLCYNPVQGAVLGYGFDKFGDQIGRALDLFGPALLKRLGAVADTLRPPTAKPPAEGAA